MIFRDPSADFERRRTATAPFAAASREPLLSWNVAGERGVVATKTLAGASRGQPVRTSRAKADCSAPPQTSGRGSRSGLTSAAVDTKGSLVQLVSTTGEAHDESAVAIRTEHYRAALTQQKRRGHKRGFLNEAGQLQICELCQLDIA
jgi:hypothetical protein